MQYDLKTNKSKQILQHLKTHGSITSWEAIEQYGATRISAVIFNIKKKHYVESERIPHIDKYGNQTAYVRYVYKGEKKE